MLMSLEPRTGTGFEPQTSLDLTHRFWLRERPQGQLCALACGSLISIQRTISFAALSATDTVLRVLSGRHPTVDGLAAFVVAGKCVMVRARWGFEESACV